MSLERKTSIITGGSSGIGLAIARHFSQMGSTVHILDLKAPQEDDSMNKLSFHSCDITNEQQVKSTIDEIAREDGLDVLVNNAGMAHIGNIEQTTGKDMDQLFNVNVKGAFHCSKAAIAHFKKQQSGVILNIASVAATVGIPDRFAYSMTKGAIISMTLSIAKDYLSDNIRCNSISPARIHTPFVDGFLAANYPGEEQKMFEALAKTQPIGRMGKPEEVAELAYFLCSDQGAFMTGMDYPIDGGFIKLNT